MPLVTVNGRDVIMSDRELWDFTDKRRLDDAADHRCCPQRLSGGRRRWLYKMVRRHCGRPWRGSPLDKLAVRLQLPGIAGSYVLGRRLGVADRTYRLGRYLHHRREGVRALDAWRQAGAEMRRPQVDWEWCADYAREHRHDDPHYHQQQYSNSAALLDVDGVTVRVEVLEDWDGSPLDDHATLSNRHDGGAWTYDRTRGESQGLGRDEYRYVSLVNWDPSENFPYYQRQGMAKGPAREQVQAVYRDHIVWIEKVLRQDVLNYGVKATVLHRGEEVATASCWGVDAENKDDDHLLEVLEECIAEAVSEAQQGVLATEQATWLHTLAWNGESGTTEMMQIRTHKADVTLAAFARQDWVESRPDERDGETEETWVNWRVQEWQGNGANILTTKCDDLPNVID